MNRSELIVAALNFTPAWADKRAACDFAVSEVGYSEYLVSFRASPNGVIGSTIGFAVRFTTHGGATRLVSDAVTA